MIISATKSIAVDVSSSPRKSGSPRPAGSQSDLGDALAQIVLDRTTARRVLLNEAVIVIGLFQVCSFNHSDTK